ncbi:MAG: hypothetical protein WCA07_02400 [Gloeobacterales cyanobacterium]
MTFRPELIDKITQTRSKQHLEEDISIHIFSVSAALVGVCLTVLGLLHLVISSSRVNTLARDSLAVTVDAVIFLTSCLLSYLALRTRSSSRMYQIERIADVIFLLGLMLMVFICGLIAYALAS